MIIKSEVADQIPNPDYKELRLKARLAWNNWPDNEHSRKAIEEHEAKDLFSARAWDRVVEALK